MKLVNELRFKMSLKLLVLAVCISVVICGPTGKVAIRNLTPFNLIKGASYALQVCIAYYATRH